MKVVQINGSPSGSTGNIAKAIHRQLLSQGDESYVFYGIGRSSEKNFIRIGNYFSLHSHAVLSRNLGKQGYFSVGATVKLIRQLKKINPDIVHLHNVHGSYVNLPMLFGYLKKSGVQVVLTLHDCWLFTGKCPHFTAVDCEKWKDNCGNCPQLSQYPRSKVDTTVKSLQDKKKWLSGFEGRLTIVTPSQWLADVTKQSFLGGYPIKVINNGIDLNVFRATHSDFRKKYCVENKKIILGVAAVWSERKGLDVFCSLAKQIRDNYRIVLVGTDDKVDGLLPESIISIHRTQDQKELAEVYTAADVFVNPTREETFPTVNIEALACGTPVVTFQTGGSPEIISEDTGIVVACDDLPGVLSSIDVICQTDLISRDKCQERACKFDAKKQYPEYYALYRKILMG